MSGVDPESLDDALVGELVSGLAAIRQVREETPEDIWREGLRVIQESVRRHSKLQSGETSYLDYVAKYVR